jgi:hypothetical protein
MLAGRVGFVERTLLCRAKIDEKRQRRDKLYSKDSLDRKKNDFGLGLSGGDQP